MKNLLLTIAVVIMILLHQDFWNWKSAEPLAFGFLPIGLTYHAIYTIVVAILMLILVTFAWPTHLEREAEESAIDHSHKDASR